MEQHEWWKDAVVYEIYPRSFQDSNGDGVGDLRGIIQRLDYIVELGADVIWLCPIYASPNDDNGYDISDYQSIQPEFGTMEDFDCLLTAAHSKGIKIVMDLVVNHTSDEHSWFAESCASRDNPYRDYYIWRNGKEGGSPNNWNSWFGGSAWQFDEATKMYYLHIFSRKQPDLNWDNPAVRNDVFKMMTWWLDKGVDGFRMDVISLISKPKELPDGPGGDLSPFCINGPRVHEYLKEMNERVLSHYDIMTVGECPGVTVDEAKKYAGKERRELSMVFQFEHTSLTDGLYGKWTDKHPYLPALKKVLNRWQNGLRGEAWNCLFWGNHDQPRAVSRFGCDWTEYRDLSAKMLCTCLYLMQGTPYIYQGEELGMTNAGFYDIDDYRDLESINAYHNFVDHGIMTKRQMLNCLANVSRDNARTPMQWNAGPCAGFTTGRPWIKLSPTWRAVNAERERVDPHSVYNFYKKTIKFRKNNPLIRDGSFTMLWPDHDKILGYTRELNGDILYVLCNFTNEVLPIPEIDVDYSSAKIIICNYDELEDGLLRPFETRVSLGHT